MLRNYIKSSLRNIIRHKGYTFINISGLTVGMATSIFIFLWVMDELSFDKFHVNKDRIYRAMKNATYSDGKIETTWSTPMRLADVMLAEVPEIDQTMRATYGQNFLIRFGEKAIYEEGLYADSTLFSIFTFPIIAGDANNPLPDIKSVAISQKLAIKFFEDENPIGQVLRVAQKYDLKVTAVFANVPENSTLQFDFAIPFEVWEKENSWAENWGNNGMQTFVSIKPGTSPEAVNEKIDSLIWKHCNGCGNVAYLFPYTKMRLKAEFENGKSTGGRIDYVISFGMVAIIILSIACINFMNLATARASTRSREVGIRKVIGAQRRGLITQFMGESLMLSFTALIFALGLVQIMLPVFNSLTNKTIHVPFQDTTFMLGLLAIALFCGITSGSYPAFFLSSFKPASVLKGVSNAALSGGGLRKTLVVIQFVVSVVLIVGSIVVYSQITYIRDKNLGFEKENVIILNQFEGVYKNQEAFKNELLQHPQIKNVGIGGHNPFGVYNSTNDPVWPGKPDGFSVTFRVIQCDQGFIPTLNMKILEGGNFSDNYKQDSANYIINEKAMEVMGLTPDNVIGTSLEMWSGKGKIIGLANDFNNQNLHEQIEPLIFVYGPRQTWRIFVKIEGYVTDAIAHIKKTHMKFDPDYPFEFLFLDEEFNKEYRSEEVLGKLCLSFTLVAVLISCLGLFGLASFTAERRQKELGVRKILGATMAQLVIMLCSDFAKLVVIGLVIGCPVAWYLASEYLSGFAFHAELGFWIFGATALGTLSIALITVAYQAARASLANPVESLRSE